MTTSQKYKVLIFGKKVFGEQIPNLSIDYCDVDILPFPKDYDKLNRLSTMIW